MEVVILSLLCVLVPVNTLLWGSGCTYCVQTQSQHPVYGMAPYASSAVDYSQPAMSPAYSYVPAQVVTSPAVYNYAPYVASQSVSTASAIDFDSLPYHAGGYAGAPVAVRYYNEPNIVNVEGAMLNSLGPGQQLARVPLFGKVRGYYSSSSSTAIRSGLYEPVRQPIRFNKYVPNTQIGDTDPFRTYHPAYSNWNKQPIQAVYREIEPPVSGIDTSSNEDEVSSIEPLSSNLNKADITNEYKAQGSAIYTKVLNRP